MSLPIPNTTATTSFVQWGGKSLCNSGWIFAANGSIDVAMLVGSTAGLVSQSDVFTVPPGQSPLAQGTDEFILGVLVRAAGGVLSTPPQQYSGALFEAQRASIGAGTPFTGTVSSSGSITPGSGMINGVTGRVGMTGGALLGTGFTAAHSGTGLYTITFTPPLASPPLLLVTPSAGLVAANQDATSPTVSSASVLIQNLTDPNPATDSQFDFIAIIPQ